MSIENYLKQVMFLIHDQRMQNVNPEDIISCINDARRTVAIRSECIRRVTPITGRITNLSIASVGINYTNPVLSISSPDYPSNSFLYPNGAQAVGSISQVGGQLTNPNLVFGGEGYWQPTVSVNDPTGTGGVVVATTSGMNVTNPGQEEYPLNKIDVSVFPGVDSIYAVKSMSILFNSYRYSLPCYSFTVYQAYIRQCSLQFRSVPCICTQVGRGTTSNILVYPIPDRNYQFELDCYCLPSPMTLQMSTEEAIPEPINDVVQYLAAHKIMIALREYNAARYFSDEFEKLMKTFVPRVNVSRWINPYGRY